MKKIYDRRKALYPLLTCITCKDCGSSKVRHAVMIDTTVDFLCEDCLQARKQPKCHGCGSPEVKHRIAVSEVITMLCDKCFKGQLDLIDKVSGDIGWKIPEE